jgi:hypothetical protein
MPRETQKAVEFEGTWWFVGLPVGRSKILCCAAEVQLYCEVFLADFESDLGRETTLANRPVGWITLMRCGVMAKGESQGEGNSSIYPVVQPTGHGHRMGEAQRSRRLAMRTPSKRGLDYSSNIRD